MPGPEKVQLEGVDMTIPGDYLGNNDGVENSGGNNPAWNEFLEVVPQELHSQVTPLLEKWDKGVQERFNKVQSEYEPWKEFKTAGVEPDQARWAINLLNQLNENPQMVYNAIGEFYKFKSPTTQQGVVTDQGQNESDKPEEDPYAARFAEIERQNQIMAQVLVNQNQAKVAADADAKLEKELNGLRKTYGEYDEQFVLSRMQAGMPAEEAVKNYFNWREAEVAKYRPKPLIMGGGGMVPGQNVNVSKLDEKGTKNLVVQYLQAAAEQNRQ